LHRVLWTTSGTTAALRTTFTRISLRTDYSGSFQAALQTKNESANTAIAEVIKEMERMRTEQVGDRELDDAKSYLTGSFPLRIDSNSKIAGFNLAVEYLRPRLDYIDRYPAIINAITKRIS